MDAGVNVRRVGFLLVVSARRQGGNFPGSGTSFRSGKSLEVL